MVDLVISGDRVVTPQGVGAFDIVIADGKIAAMAAKGSLPVPEGVRHIDATGKIVMPGGIDPHVHCKWHLPNPDGTAGLTEPPGLSSPGRRGPATITLLLEQLVPQALACLGGVTGPALTLDITPLRRGPIENVVRRLNESRTLKLAQKIARADQADSFIHNRPSLFDVGVLKQQ